MSWISLCKNIKSNVAHLLCVGL